MARSSKVKIPVVSWVIFTISIVSLLLNFSSAKLNLDSEDTAILLFGFAVIAIDTIDLIVGKFNGKIQTAKYYKRSAWVLFALAILGCFVLFFQRMNFFVISTSSEGINYFQFNPRQNFSFLNNLLGETKVPDEIITEIIESARFKERK